MVSLLCFFFIIPLPSGMGLSEKQQINWVWPKLGESGLNWAVRWFAVESLLHVVWLSVDDSCSCCWLLVNSSQVMKYVQNYTITCYPQAGISHPWSHISHPWLAKAVCTFGSCTCIIDYLWCWNGNDWNCLTRIFVRCICQNWNQMYDKASFSLICCRPFFNK